MNIIKKILLPLYAELRIWFDERKRFVSEIKSILNTQNLSIEGDKKFLYRDYKRAFCKHRVSPSEYLYQFKFYSLTESERCEFLSVSTMQRAYRRLVDPEVRRLFYDKVNFLTQYSEFIHRKWLNVSAETSFESFRSFLSGCESVIVKPVQGSQGYGIRKIERVVDVDLKRLFVECKSGGR